MRTPLKRCVSRCAPSSQKHLTPIIRSPTNSGWTKFSATWIVIKMPNSHLMNSSREANRIPRSYRYELPIPSHTAFASPDHAFPRPCPCTTVLCSTLACFVDDSVAYSATHRLSFHYSAICPGGIGFFPSLVFVVAVLSSMFTNQTRTFSFIQVHELVQGPFLLSRSVIVLGVCMTDQSQKTYTRYPSLLARP